MALYAICLGRKKNKFQARLTCLLSDKFRCKEDVKCRLELLGVDLWARLRVSVPVVCLEERLWHSKERPDQVVG